MKNIALRPIFFCSLLFLCFANAKAQLGIVKKPGISIGANFIYSMPQGSFKDSYQMGVGGELFGGVGWGSTYLLASVGITGYKHQGSYSNTLTAVPVKIGLKKYFLLKKIFITGDIGSVAIKSNGEKVNAFTAGFGAGVRLLGLELSLYQNTFKNNGAYSSVGYSNSLNAKIGWSFAL